MIEVEGTIFAFEFSKKYDISLLSIKCRVLDRCQAFHQLASVDAHLCREYQSTCYVAFCISYLMGSGWHAYGETLLDRGIYRVQCTPSVIHK
jgi:hypothetical protein